MLNVFDVFSDQFNRVYFACVPLNKTKKICKTAPLIYLKLFAKMV